MLKIFLRQVLLSAYVLAATYELRVYVCTVGTLHVRVFQAASIMSRYTSMKFSAIEYRRSKRQHAFTEVG